MKAQFIQTDSPVTKKQDDDFQRYSFASRIANVVANHPTTNSLVVGLYGKWGEGKSSVLGFVNTELSTKENVVTVNFNPWLFTEEKQLLLYFFQTLATSLEESLKGKDERVGELIRKYAGGIGMFTSLAGLPNAKGLFESLGKALSDKPIEHHKEKINEIIESSNKKIIVFIDDIDRLAIKEVQAIFRLVKLTADFKNTIYVLAFDDELVSASLDPLYSKGGQDFLEKIIQLPLRLPKAQPAALRKYTIDKLDQVLKHLKVDLTVQEVDRFTYFFNNYFLPKLENPRIAIRFANSISFSIPLLRGEVNLVDLTIIEGIKVMYPESYTFIRNHARIFISGYSPSPHTSGNEQVKSYLEDYLSQHLPKKKEKLVQLFKTLFPQLKSIYDNYYYSDDIWQEWYANKRVCSGQYFDRYFTYTVNEGEISDVHFDELLYKLSSKDYSNNVSELQNQVSVLDTSNFVMKLKFLEESFDVDNSALIAQNVAMLGDLFSDSNLSFGSDLSLASSFIAKLIEKQHRQDRVTIAKKVISESRPIAFAFRIWNKLHPDEKSSEKHWILSQKDFNQVSTVLWKRVTHEVPFESLFEELNENNLRYLLIIWSENDQNEIQTKLKKYIEESPNRFIKLLKAFSITTITIGDNSEPYKSNFTLAYYLSLEKIIDIDYFYEKSVKLYKNQTLKGTLDSSRELKDEELVALFQKVHLSQQEQNEKE